MQTTDQQADQAKIETLVTEYLNPARRPFIDYDPIADDYAKWDAVKQARVQARNRCISR